jgi:hypothetical protein
MRRVTLLFSLLLGLPGSWAKSGAAGPLISEFLADPTAAVGSEWMEIYNPDVVTHDLSRFRVGDRLDLHPISDTALPIPPQGYMIIAEDDLSFRQYYPLVTCPVVSPADWAILNNDGDCIRIADNTGLVYDSVPYARTHDDNRSWERFIDLQGQSYWGESFSPTGSTPGAKNLFVFPRARAIALAVSPDPFSPDGDGFEDRTTIRYDLPEGDRFDLVIYDLSGQAVRHLCDEAPSFPGEITWDGRADDGRRLEVGIYVIFGRISGERAASAKTTVVIAR